MSKTIDKKNQLRRGIKKKKKDNRSPLKHLSSKVTKDNRISQKKRILTTINE